MALTAHAHAVDGVEPQRVVWSRYRDDVVDEYRSVLASLSLALEAIALEHLLAYRLPVAAVPALCTRRSVVSAACLSLVLVTVGRGREVPASRVSASLLRLVRHGYCAPSSSSRFAGQGGSSHCVGQRRQGQSSSWVPCAWWQYGHHVAMSGYLLGCIAMPASLGRRSALRSLQERQQATRLHSWSLPPRDLGMMWSMVRCTPWDLPQ